MYIRLAEEKDFEFFYKLKCEKNNLYWSGFENKPNYNNFLEFFKKTISEDGRKIYIIINDVEDKVGHLYFSKNNCDVFELAIAVSEKYNRRGYGKSSYLLALKMGLELGYKRCECWIREDNEISINLHEIVGFKFTGEKTNQFIENKNSTMKMLLFAKDL